jgi:hypothetical protein
LVRLVLGEKMEIEQAAAAMGLLGTSEQGDRAVIERLRQLLCECLDVLAREFSGKAIH